MPSTHGFRTFLAASFAAVLLTSNVHAAELKLSIGVSAMKNIFDKITVPFEKETGIKLTFIGAKGGVGGDEVFTKLAEASVDGGAVGSTFEAWVKLAEDKKLNFEKGKGMQHSIIGRDRVHVLAHKDTGVKKLTKAQMTDLFSGKVTNWKQVGGSDVPVAILLSAAQPNANKAFREKGMDGAEFVKSAKMVEQDVDTYKKAIATTSGAAGLGPINLADSSVLAPEIPEVGRPIIFVTNGRPSAEIRKLLDFIRDNGAKYGIAR